MTDDADNNDADLIFRKMLDDAATVVDCLAGGPAPAVVILNRDAAVTIILAVIAILKQPGAIGSLASMLGDSLLEGDDDANNPP